MSRQHCFISASSVTGVRRWRWQTETTSGSALRMSGCDFGSFDECAKHAFAHGYSHVEVPVLEPLTTPVHTVPPIVTARELDAGEPDLHQDDPEDIAEGPLLSDASPAMLSGPLLPQAPV